MTIEQFLPLLIIVESFGASVFYCLAGDFNSASYWALAGGLSLVVTFKPF